MKEMKANSEKERTGIESMKDLQEKTQTARLNNVNSASSIYDLVYMNSAITGANVSRQTCVALLEQMEEWNFLPLRLRNSIMEDILAIMTEQTLPPYEAVWEKIHNHPLYVRYRSGEMPAVSVQESIQESDENEKRNSDIAQLRMRTSREAQFVTALNEEYLQFHIEEAPTESQKITPIPHGKDDQKKSDYRWDQSGPRYSHTSKKRA